MTAPTLEPVRAGERVTAVDVLRGFALLGILLVNFGGKVGAWLPSMDRAVQTGLDLLVTESFYPLFSFLFGLGLALQLTRARGAGLVHLYLRRLLVLFLIGTVHSLLIWDGDILVQYAMLGVLLIPLHRLPSRGVLLVALLLMAFQFGQSRVREAVEGWHSTPERERDRELATGLREERYRVEGNLELRAEEDGSWRDNLESRWHKYSRKVNRYLHPLSALGADYLLLFVLGLYVGRRRLLEQARSHRRGLAVVAVVGAIAALVGNALPRWYPDVGAEAELALWMAANYGMTMFYIAGLTVLAARGRRAAQNLSVLGPVGRMGLTNYLLQSLVMTFLFFPYGIGIPDLGATLRLLVDLGFFFLVQVPLSHWWLARYRFGPAEWVWRSLTYGRFQPMRLGEVAPQPVPLLEVS